jgi:hypothetical protein
MPIGVNVDDVSQDMALNPKALNSVQHTRELFNLKLNISAEPTFVEAVRHKSKGAQRPCVGAP